MLELERRTSFPFLTKLTEFTVKQWTTQNSSSSSFSSSSAASANKRKRKRKIHRRADRKMVTADNNAADLDDPDYCSSKRTRELALINPPRTTTAAGISSRYSAFKLPDGWGVEAVPRSGSPTVDKYYYEPGTGRKFRSLKAVERYINGEEAEFTQKTRAITWHDNDQKEPTEYRKMIICGGKVVKLTEDTLNKSHLPIIASSETAANSPYNLPDGWIIEEVPRSNASHIDKYYYEPGTGRKFRSLSAAQRHAAELNEDAPLSALVEEIKDMNRPLSQTIKLCQGVKKPSSSNKKSTKTSDQTSSFVDLPEKVEWVLHSHRGDEWKPFLCDRAIPDSLKEQWRERFLVAMNANNRTQ